MSRRNGYELVQVKPQMRWRLEKWGKEVQTFSHKSDAQYIMDNLLARHMEKEPTWVLVSKIWIGDVIFLYNRIYSFVDKDKTSCTFTLKDSEPVEDRTVRITRGMIWTGDLDRPTAPSPPVGMTKIALPVEVLEAIGVFVDHSVSNGVRWGFKEEQLTEAQETLEDWAADPYAIPEEKK